MTICIVYATTAEGERFALAAYTSKPRAEAHIRRCEASDKNRMSASELLGVQLSISTLTVLEGD